MDYFLSLSLSPRDVVWIPVMMLWIYIESLWSRRSETPTNDCWFCMLSSLLHIRDTLKVVEISNPRATIQFPYCANEDKFNIDEKMLCINANDSVL